jgi:hypothetical protein
VSQDLGKQVELQAQLNKLLQEQVRLQSKLSGACGEQSRCAGEMNDAADENAKKQEKAILGQGKLAAEQDKARKSQDKQSKSADGFFSKMSTGTAAGAGGVLGLVSGFKDMGISLKGVGGLLKSFVGGLFSIGSAIIAIPFKLFSGLVGMANNAAQAGTALRQAYEDVRKEFGSFAEGPAKNVIAGFKDMSSSAGNLAGTGLSASRVFGYGPDGMAKMMGAVSDIAKGLGPAINLLGDEFGKSAEKAVMFSKGLGLSGEQMGKLMKDAALSGKSQTDMMTEVGSMSLQMAKKFDLSSKDIGKDIADMKGDFVSFGNMSTTQMGAASAYARKLGMDMKDLKGVVDKFDDFEGAADSVSQLNQAFGIQLDTMKMMNAENPAERIDMMRNAFHAAGKSIETMTRQEKKLMMAQTGLSESALQNAFAAENQGVAYEDFADAAGDAEENQLSQEEVMLKLAKAIEKIAEAGQSFSGIGDAFGKGFMRAMSKDKDMRALMETIRSFLKTVFQFGQDIGKVFMKLMKSTKMFEGLQDLFNPKKFKAFFKDIEETVKKFADFLITGTGNPEDILQEFVDKISGFVGGKGKAMGQIGSAFMRLGEFLLVTLKVVGKWLWKKVQPVLISAFDAVKGYLSKNWKPIAMFIAKWVIAPMFVLAMIKGLAFAAGGGLLKILAAGMTKWVLASAATAKAGAAAGGAAPAAGGFAAFIASFAAIPWPAIGKATVVLLALVTLFAVAVVAFSAAVALAATMLEKVTWGGIAKTFLVVGAAILSTVKLVAIGFTLSELLPLMIPAGIGLVAAAVLFTVGVMAYSIAIDKISEWTEKIKWIKFASTLAGVGIAIAATVALLGAGVVFALAGFGMVAAAAGLVGAAALFRVGILEYAKAIDIVQTKAEDINWKKFASTLAGVGIAVLATGALFVSGGLMALGGLGFIVAAIGLKAGAAFFEGAILIFASAIESAMPAFKLMHKNKEVVSFGLFALDKIIDSIIKLKRVAKSFGIMSAIFGSSFTKGVKTAAEFFIDTTPSIIKMIKAISEMKIKNASHVKLQIEIVGAAVAAMQQLGEMGIKVGKLARVSKMLTGGKMDTMINAMSKFVLAVGVSLTIVIKEISKMAKAMPGGKDNNAKARIVAQIIAAVAQLASALFSPLKVVSELGGGMFGPGPQKTMDAVIGGVTKILLAIKTDLPVIVKSVLDLEKHVGDPKTAEPKMKIVSLAVESVAKFATGLGAAMKMIPTGETAWYKKDKDMKERVAQMMCGIKGVIGVITENLEVVVKAITGIKIDGDLNAITKKVVIVEKTMSALTMFGDVIQKWKGSMSGKMGAAVFIATVAAVVEGFVKAIGPTAGGWDISDIFDYLKTFKPDESLLTKVDSAIKTIGKVSKFGSVVADLPMATSIGSLAGKIEGLVGGLKTSVGTLNSLNDIGGVKIKMGPLKSFGKALMRVSSIFKGYQAKYFGPDGIMATAAGDMVEAYNSTYEAFQNLNGGAPIDLSLKLDKFAEALGVTSDKFTIKSDQLNFTVNIKVELDAEKMVDTISDKKKMGERTVKLAAR